MSFHTIADMRSAAAHDAQLIAVCSKAVGRTQDRISMTSNTHVSCNVAEVPVNGALLVIYQPCRSNAKD